MPWEDFKTLFETAAMVHGWTEETKASTLCLALRGDALGILQAMPMTERYNFEELIKRLEMRFGNKHMEQVYRSQLKNRVQKAGESLQEFEADVARLVRHAYSSVSDDVYESLAVDVFLDGLREPETQLAVKLSRPKTLREALTEALEFEAVRQSVRGHASVRAIKTDAAYPPTVEELFKKILEVITTKKNEIQCWNCGEMVHLRTRRKRTKAEKKREEKVATVRRITVTASERHDTGMERVSANTLEDCDREKESYDVAEKGGFQPGDLVWLHNPRRRRGYCPKLQSSWEGPFVVMSRINDVVYRIKKQPKGKPKIVHFNRLAPYKGDHDSTEGQHVRGVTIKTLARDNREQDQGQRQAEIRIMYKDLFSLPAEYALAHCVAKDLKTSRGIATVFRRKFGGMDDLERQKPLVGKTLHRDHQGQRLFYLVTKEAAHQRVSEDDLRRCLVDLRTLALRLGIKKLAMPKLGHGYDGLRWDLVKQMLEEIFHGTGVTLFVCVFNPWKTKAAAIGSHDATVVSQGLVWDRPVLRKGQCYGYGGSRQRACHRLTRKDANKEKGAGLF